MDINTKAGNILRCCEKCNCRSNEKFSKLLNLKHSGLLVYIHNDGKVNTYEKQSIILHNVRNEPLKKSDFYDELCRYTTECCKCNTLIQRVCNLVKKIRDIRENEIIAICKHGKRASIENKCKRCDYLIQMFFNNKMKFYEDQQQTLNIRLYEVRRILSLIMDKKGICEHKVCQLYYNSDAELKLLLELLKNSLPKRQPNIEEDIFFSETHIPSICQYSDKDLFMKYRQELDNVSNKSFGSTTSGPEGFCICKYLQNRKLDVKQPVASLINEPEQVTHIQSTLTSKMLTPEKSISTSKDIAKKLTYGKIPSSPKKISKLKRMPKQSRLGEGIKSKEEERENNIPLNRKKSEKNEEDKNISSQKDTDYKVMLDMIKAKEKENREINQKLKVEKIPAMPKIKDLPKLKAATEVVEIESEQSGSIVECSQEQPVPEIIHGTKILPLLPHLKRPYYANEPLIFKVKHDFVLDEHVLTPSVTPGEKTSVTYNSVSPDCHGIFSYKLSNRMFIDKGWTKLPSINIMRRMNVYKMIPAYPEFDWFANHKKKKSISYSTGQKLAEIDDSGSGRWFYKNGSIALEYTKGLNSKRMYAVYRINDELKGAKKTRRKVVALFDHLGNGIVYDDNGNVRLKYNQSEGVVIDKKIGPPSKWKWHSLNDPPVLKHVYLDTTEETNPCVNELVNQHIEDSELKRRVDNEDMLAIELQNFMKEKADKILQNYRPFKIKAKVIKINECFSMRIISQANIYLTFRLSQNCLKVNLGMWLKNDEIIDTITSDITDVNTPFDSPVLDSE